MNLSMQIILELYYMKKISIEDSTIRNLNRKGIEGYMEWQIRTSKCCLIPTSKWRFESSWISEF